ncbi:MAG: ABC transporter substrate-binding protein [Desulfobacterales bacterium]|nr:ABC transporter substrate-binding protein [Desulfobacterales bacterium]
METKGKLFLVTILASIFISFSSLCGYAEDVRGVTDTMIKIGGILDQTGPVAGDITIPATEGFRNYMSHVNDKGGIFGRKIKVIIEDDRYSIPTCIAAFKKLLFKDEIFALFGPANTGGARALFGQIEKLKVPNLTGAPDEAQVNPLKRHIFMPFNTYHDQFGVILDYIVNDLKAKKIDVTFVYFDAESGKVALASVRRWAKFFNFSFNTEIINMGALDAASQVMSIKRNNPTHILIHHGSPGTVALLRDLRKFGLNTPVYGDMITCTEDTVRMGGSASKNYIGAHPVSSWYDDGKDVEEMRRITLKYKPGTEMPYRNKIHTLGWIVATSLCEGLKRAGRYLSIEEFVTAMESIRDMDTGGLSCPISFSPTNHQGMHHTKLYRADPESGKLVPITDWRKTPEIK